jgi:hypothetical protein
VSCFTPLFPENESVILLNVFGINVKSVLKLIDRSRICSDRYPFSLYSAKGSYVTTPQNINVDEFEMHWINMFKNVSLLIEEAVTNPFATLYIVLPVVLLTASSESSIPSENINDI